MSNHILKIIMIFEGIRKAFKSMIDLDAFFWLWLCANAHRKQLSIIKLLQFIIQNL